jgi:hypothetical protein
LTGDIVNLQLESSNTITFEKVTFCCRTSLAPIPNTNGIGISQGQKKASHALWVIIKLKATRGVRDLALRPYRSSTHACFVLSSRVDSGESRGLIFDFLAPLGKTLMWSNSPLIFFFALVLLILRMAWSSLCGKEQ